MKKVLLVATVQSHIYQFHKPLVKMLHEHGYEVEVAARDNLGEKDGIKLDFVEKVYDVCFNRNPFSRENLKAYKQLKKIVLENKYDYIHCNTPTGGLVTRLLPKKIRKQGTQIIYTAHGFHFYKGAPRKNWLMYYPVEKMLAKRTDKLITITHEDFEVSKKDFKVKTYFTHGVGVDSNRFYKVTQEEALDLKKKLELPLDKKIILCVGELNDNKNQISILRCIKELKNKYNDLYLLIAGNGICDEMLKEYTKENELESCVKFLGYKRNIEEYTKCCDIIISASYREGLPLNIVEGMMCAKTIIASNNRGHRELILNDVNGYIFEKDDLESMYNAFEKAFVFNEEIINASHIKSQYYNFENVEEELKNIYFGE